MWTDIIACIVTICFCCTIALGLLVVFDCEHVDD